MINKILICNKCGGQFHSDTYMTSARLRKIAKDGGWGNRGKIDLCPKCFKDLKQDLKWREKFYL